MVRPVLRVPGRALWVCLLSTACPGAGAQTASEVGHDPLDPLDPIVVVAGRAPQPLSTIGNSVTVLSQAVITESQALDVPTLLGQTPGISFVRNGGLGSTTQVYVRGAESGQTLVRIDGVQLNDPSSPDSGFDFASLLTGDISRIEILRGSHSALYGSQAIGGVIDITTTPPATQQVAELGAEAGSRSSGLVTAGLGAREGRLAWRLAGEHFQTAGIPDFDRRFGGTTLDRSSNDGASGSLDVALADGFSLDLRGYTTHARNRFDGYDTPTGAFGNDLEYGTIRQWIGYAGLNANAWSGRLKQRFALQYTETDRHNFDPALAPVTETFYGIGRNRRFEYQGTLALDDANRLVFGAQTERSSVSTDTPAYDAGAPGLVRAAAATRSAYAELTSTFAHSLTLSAGARVDDHEEFGAHTTLQVALAWHVPDAPTVLRASYGQGFKAPALYQLYSQYGNAHLRPETSASWDAGVVRELWTPRATVALTVFARDSHDLIGFFDCTTPSPLCATEPFGYYANTTIARAHGLEAEAVLPLAAAWTLHANYTYLNDEDRSPGAATYGRELLRRPKEMANATLSYCAASRLTASAALRFAGRSFDDAANQVRLAPYALLDLRVDYALDAHTELYGRIENVTDRQYETAYQYGTLGRGFFVGLRAHL